MERSRFSGDSPSPSVWPVGFAIGIAVLLVGLIVSPLFVSPLGALIAIVSGFQWVRDAGAAATPLPPVEAAPSAPTAPSPPAAPAHVGEAAMPPPRPEERFPRSRFLEGATLGLGGLIGGLVTVPVAGFAILPAFTGQRAHPVDLGPLSDFPEGRYVVATFMLDPAEGEVSRRTAYVRNNGLVGSVPSFTVLSNRCVHLGCPVQPNGPLFEQQRKLARGKNGAVALIPTQPAGFGCPCHGGQYDTEGNRVAGPPVRALDRYQFSIINGRLWLERPYSVSHVDGQGAQARIDAYRLAGPGQHVDGPEAWLYPLQPPQH